MSHILVEYVILLLWCVGHPEGRKVNVEAPPACAAGRRCICAGAPSRADLTVCGAFVAEVDTGVVFIRVLCVLRMSMKQYVCLTSGPTVEPPARARARSRLSSSASAQDIASKPIAPVQPGRWIAGNQPGRQLPQWSENRPKGRRSPGS